MLNQRMNKKIHKNVIKPNKIRNKKPKKVNKIT